MGWEVWVGEGDDIEIGQVPSKDMLPQALRRDEEFFLPELPELPPGERSSLVPLSTVRSTAPSSQA